MEGGAGTSPPYPLTPEEWQELQHREESEWRQQQQQQPSSSELAALDLRDLDSGLAGTAQPTTDRKKDQELPDALKVAVPRDGEVKRSSSELRRDYAKGAIPDALRPGAGRKSAEPLGPVPAAADAVAATPPSSAAAAAVAATPPSSAAPPAPPPAPPALGHCKPVCLLPLPLHQSTDTACFISTASPLRLAANLSAADHPFSEY